MGFSHQVQTGQFERIPSPAQRKIRWRGGEHLEEGRYRLSYYDKERDESVEYKLPFVICPLDSTTTITGGGEGYRYWSNESVYGTTMKLHRTTYHDDGSYTDEIVAEGTYQQIVDIVGVPDKNGKKHLPADMKYTNNLYYYNFESKQIEVFEMKGSAVRPFFNYTKANRGWNQKKLKIAVDEELKKTGAVYYYQPAYFDAGEYSDEEKEIMNKADAEVVDYIKTITKVGADADSVDQTPAQYDGEQSQENDEVDLSDVPFI